MRVISRLSKLSSHRGTKIFVYVPKFVVLALAAVLTAEFGLQIGALVVTDRSGSGTPLLAPRRVVCLGDSHTFGAGVPTEDSYPAQLQRILEQERPGQYSVINAGVPGMNTKQAADRLAAYISRFDPQTVVIWSGCNNAWNLTGEDNTSSWLHAVAEGLATRSRLYRLIRVKLHDRELERGAAAAESKPTLKPLGPRDPDALPPNYSIGVNGQREELKFLRRELTVDEGMRDRLFRDLRVIASEARAADVQLVFITYPGEFGAFAAANAALRAVASEYGIVLVDGAEASARVPKALRKFIWAYHPTGPIYGEIAEDVAAIVLAKDSQ